MGWRSDEILVLGGLKFFTSAPRNHASRDEGIKLRGLLIEFTYWLEMVASF